MKRFLKASELGITTSNYRAKVLGIKAIGKTLKGEKIYSLQDAEKILAYKPIYKTHSIVFHTILEVIINNPNLRYNAPEAARIFKIKESKVQSLLDEYAFSGCLVVESKMNYETEE